MAKLTGLLASAALGLAALGAATSANAQATATGTVTIDENGYGVLTLPAGTTALSSGFLPDPGPGGGLGLDNLGVLAYALPANLNVVEGDVELDDESGRSDIIRFISADALTGAPEIFFYSTAEVSGLGFTLDSFADAIVGPSSLFTNSVFLPEVGTAGQNGAIYTPTAGQPGFVSGFVITYNFISDGSAVPEPSTWAMMLLGFGAISLAMRRSRKAAVVLA